MRMSYTLVFVAFATCLVLSGCHSSDSAKDKIYEVKGKVISVDAAKKKITLDHEAIPGLMKAMKMPFDVEDAKLLDGVKADDQVHGKLRVKDGSYIITEWIKH